MTTSISGTGGITFPDLSVQNTAATGFGFKNRIINGAMVIDQRNAGSSQTVTTAGTAYTLDRWTLYTAGANITSQRVSASAAGYQYGWQITGASSNTAVVAGQRIESANCWDLASQTITLSFKIYNSGSSTTMTAEPAYPTSVDNFGSVTYFLGTTLTIPNGWSTQTYTFVANSNCINGLVIYHNFGALGSGVTRIITGYQIELGSTATAFDYRPYGTELLLCQRYYQSIAYPRTFMDISGATAFFSPVYFIASMRTAPTITLPSGAGNVVLNSSGTATAPAYQWNATNITTNSFSLRGGTPNIAGIVEGTATASAEL